MHAIGGLEKKYDVKRVKANYGPVICFLDGLLYGVCMLVLLSVFQVVVGK